MTIYSKLDENIELLREIRDKNEENSQNFLFYSINIDALQRLRKDALGRYLPDKCGKVVFIDFESLKVEFKIKRTYEEQD